MEKAAGEDKSNFVFKIRTPLIQMWWVALSGLRFKSSEFREVSILKWIYYFCTPWMPKFSIFKWNKKTYVTWVINERLSPSGKQKCATRIWQSQISQVTNILNKKYISWHTKLWINCYKCVIFFRFFFLNNQISFHLTLGEFGESLMEDIA